MSKLSEAVKGYKEAEEATKLTSKLTIKNIKEFDKEIYEKVSECEFDAYSSDDNYYIVIPELFGLPVVVVRFNKITEEKKTVFYDYATAKSGIIVDLDAFESLDYEVNSTAIGGDECGFVDVQELSYYCSKVAKPLQKRAKVQLNKEIDEGYKNPQMKKKKPSTVDERGRMSLGGETLEEDIAFNEYMHKRFRGV
mgnify:CR=1 FL=1